MAAIAPPPMITPPPVPPGLDQGLNAYLQQFSLWASNGFAATLSNNQALPGMLLQANDAAAGVSPATYQLAIDSAGALETRLIASGSGAAGPWMTVASSEGVTDGSNAAAGEVGEWVTASVSGTLVSATAANVGSMSLTAGDWDVEGVLQFSFSGTVGQIAVVGVSTTSGVFPAPGATGRAQINTAANILSAVDLPTGATRVSITANTNVYLVAEAYFSSGTCSVTGALRARRMR